MVSDLIFSLRETSVSFGKKIIFDNLDVNIHRKDLIALIGKNGVGKSTLMRIISDKQDLDQGEVRLEVLEYWASPHTGARYPVQWTLAIPSEELEMDVTTVFDDQEMTVSVQYYEGALQVSGKFRDEAIDGNGYIEMTGYEQD